MLFSKESWLMGALFSCIQPRSQSLCLVLRVLFLTAPVPMLQHLGRYFDSLSRVSPAKLHTNICFHRLSVHYSSQPFQLYVYFSFYPGFAPGNLVKCIRTRIPIGKGIKRCETNVK